MHTRSIRQRFVGGLTALIILSLLAVPATATHNWDEFHWARTSNPFILQVGVNFRSDWEPYFIEAISEWTSSSVLDLVEVPGANGTPLSVRTCNPTLGRIEICSAAYVPDGVLGVARIWTSGGGDHITQATIRLNDTYFFNPNHVYNTPAWRRTVMCHEIGHTLPLYHTDPAADSCMNHRNFFEHPNAHDYEQLETVYLHLDSTSSIGASTADAAAAEAEIEDDLSDWGEVIERDGRGQPSLYRKDLGRGAEVYTFVTLVEDPQGPQVDPSAGDDGTAKDGKKGKAKAENDKKKGKHHKHRR